MKRIALVTVLTALALGACQAAEEKLAEHMARGDQYVEQEEFGAAIIEIECMIRKLNAGLKSQNGVIGKSH